MTLKSIASLYGHWCTADAVKQFVGTALPESAKSGTQLPPKLTGLAEMYSKMMRLQVWYALLYVVVEGYGELQDSDPEIDQLLSDKTMVDSMRRFRNAIFHPQEDQLSEKLLGFLTMPGSEDWPRKLNSAFKR